MVLAFYILSPIVVLWYILHKLLGKIRGLTFTFLIASGFFLYCLCFIAGLFFSFWIVPQSYWYSIDIDMSYWDAHAFPPDITPAHYLIIPYVFFIFLIQNSWSILIHHFTWGFAISYGFFIWIYSNWCFEVYMAFMLRHPNFGFDDSGEYARYDAMMRKHMKALRQKEMQQKL